MRPTSKKRKRISWSDLITYAAWKGLDRVYNMVEKETERKYGKDKHI
jgi:hypothetical protein